MWKEVNLFSPEKLGAWRNHGDHLGHPSFYRERTEEHGDEVTFGMFLKPSEPWLPHLSKIWLRRALMYPSYCSLISATQRDINPKALRRMLILCDRKQREGVCHRQGTQTDFLKLSCISLIKARCLTEFVAIHLFPTSKSHPIWLFSTLASFSSPLRCFPRNVLLCNSTRPLQILPPHLNASAQPRANSWQSNQNKTKDFKHV